VHRLSEEALLVVAQGLSVLPREVANLPRLWLRMSCILGRPRLCDLPLSGSTLLDADLDESQVGARCPVAEPA